MMFLSGDAAKKATELEDLIEKLKQSGSLKVKPLTEEEQLKLFKLTKIFETDEMFRLALEAFMATYLVVLLGGPQAMLDLIDTMEGFTEKTMQSLGRK